MTTKRKPRSPIPHKQIKSGRLDNLSVSRDFDERPDRPHAVMLFTPDMENTVEHWHIKLNMREAKALRGWLDRFLGGRPKPAKRKARR